eukprot:m.455331 g.455331  ORF g.455331 m.455331 type:complete len:270 (+) comp56958_c1_seq38:1341-2150(+)
MTMEEQRLITAVCTADFPWSASDCSPSFRPIQQNLIATPRKFVGWRQEKDVASQCDFDIRNELSPDEFLSDYLLVQRPVIIRNHHRNDPKWEKLRKAFQREAFVQSMGTCRSLRFFGLESTPTTIKEFLDRPATTGTDVPEYVFEASNQTLAKTFVLPKLVDVSFTSKQFYLGSKGSGAPIHYHGNAINTLVYGRKQWFLLPPSLAVYSKQPPSVWLPSLSANEQSQLLRCTQEEGDLFFVPEYWAHAVLNAEDVIGFANEFNFGVDSF